jgi:hypothetical protein
MARALKIAVVVAVLAVPSLAFAAGPGTQARAITCLTEHYKPARIILACGDAGIWLGRLKWSRWTASTAKASGTYNENTCTPTCVAGHTVSRPVEVTLSKPKTCRGETHATFRHATFTFPSGPPPHAYRRFTFRCPSY